MAVEAQGRQTQKNRFTLRSFQGKKNTEKPHLTIVPEPAEAEEPTALQLFTEEAEREYTRYRSNRPQPSRALVVRECMAIVITHVGDAAERISTTIPTQEAAEIVELVFWEIPSTIISVAAQPHIKRIEEAGGLGRIIGSRLFGRHFANTKN